MDKQYFVKLNGYYVKDKRINDIVDNKLKVNYLSIGTEPVSSTDVRHLGDCIVITGEKNILLDLGFQTDCNHLISFLNDNDIDRIDTVIISHYHGDHIGGVNAEGLTVLLNTNTIDFSNCTFYLPHKGIDWSLFHGATYSQVETYIKNLLTSKNINYIEPDNEDIVTLTDSLQLQFFNIGSNYYENYYDEQTNWNMSEIEHTIYNNFSMVVILKHFNNKFLFTGDIEPLAQSKLYKYFKDIDVLKVEHHGLNYNSDTNYLNQLNPKYAVIGELDNIPAINLARNCVYNLYTRGATIFGTIKAGDVTITSSYNKITAEANETLDLFNMQYSLYEGLPLIAGDDLNNFNIPGVYYSKDGTLTSVLLHKPAITTGFKLIVERMTHNNLAIKQTIISNTGAGGVYTRTKTGENWNMWRCHYPSLNLTIPISKMNVSNSITVNNSWSYFQTRNSNTLISFEFTVNTAINSSTDIIVIPNNLEIDGETINFTTNKLVNVSASDNTGAFVPMYIGADENTGLHLRSRVNLAQGKTIRLTTHYLI